MPVKKTELWTTMAGIAATLLAPKLGVPEENLSDFFMSVAAMVSAYSASRGWVKGKEVASSASDATSIVTKTPGSA